MSGVMYGADADELDRVASEFIRAADDLDRDGGALTGILNNISWLGDTAGRFLSDWTGVQLPKIGLSTRFLRESAATLHENARAQRAASNGGGSGSGGGMEGLNSSLANIAFGAAEATRRRAEMMARLRPGLDAMAGASAAEQLDWWNSLTSDEQALLISMAPVALLALKGLPADARRRAEDSYVSSIEDEIVTRRSGVEAEASVSIKIVEISAGFSLEQTEYMDGSVELTFGAHAGVGVDVEVAEAIREAGLEGTYRFDSAEDAQRFLDGLRDAAMWELKKGTSTVDDIVGYLGDESGHFESVKISQDVGVKIDGGNANVELGYGVSAEKNVRTGAVTLEASAYGSSSVRTGLAGIEATGGGELSAALQFDDGRPSEVTFSFDYEGKVSAGLHGPVDSNLGVTHSGRADVTFDLTDPAVATVASQAAEAVARGDVESAAQMLEGLYDRAEIKVQQFVGSESEFGFDYGAIKAEGSASVEAATSTYVKPPGSGFIEVH